ncbi:hypothetical protein CLV72_110101 [Allonocardiopsis opalescens]|uniref:Uncharacterized protein n=2 Tax=Allonocardiopsis opalescens TaxID=1144618 RepID=A0A2T0PTW7_9ACTN|nr:hypothetical protein CLV72_110101 [Allonocardiopsis opalescens]
MALSGVALAVAGLAVIALCAVRLWRGIGRLEAQLRAVRERAGPGYASVREHASRLRSRE